MDSDRVKVIGIFVIVFFVLCGYFYFTQGRQNIQQAKLQKQQFQQLTQESKNDSESDQEDTDKSKNLSSAKEKEKYVDPDSLYKVHIAGEVKKPGVYSLEEKARVIDAIEIAGGPTDEADLDRVNLAEFVKDGEKIRIPSFRERMASDSSSYGFDMNSNNVESISLPSSSSKSRYNFEKASKTGEQKTDTKEIKEKEEREEKEIEKKDSDLININKASVDELKELPGVGSTIANSIVMYREENGDFETIEDLKNVSRIGDKTFNKIKDFITVD